MTNMLSELVEQFDRSGSPSEVVGFMCASGIRYGVLVRWTDCQRLALRVRVGMFTITAIEAEFVEDSETGTLCALATFGYGRLQTESLAEAMAACIEARRILSEEQIDA